MDTLIDLKDSLDQINLGEMPPKKSKQPSQQEQKVFIEQATLSLTEGRESLASTGGSTVLRRLNRREYINTIGDLFAMNMAAFDPTTKFPRDQSAEHMENLGDVLQTSGYLLDQYLDAADAIIEKAFAVRQKPEERFWRQLFGERNRGNRCARRVGCEASRWRYRTKLDRRRHSGVVRHTGRFVDLSCRVEEPGDRPECRCGQILSTTEVGSSVSQSPPPLPATAGRAGWDRLGRHRVATKHASDTSAENELALYVSLQRVFGVSLHSTRQ